MKLTTCRCIPAALLLATAAAQTPGEAAPTPRDASQKSGVTLQSLPMLTNEVVYIRQPLTTGERTGTHSDQPFARIRDARFERDGRLAALLVDAPEGAAAGGQPASLRLLPARVIRWDEATRRWLGIDTNLQFAELPEAPKADAAGKGKTDHLLASALQRATVTAGGSPPKPATEPAAGAEVAAGGAKPNVVLWLAPGQQTLAFAVVNLGSSCVPLPWSLLRPGDDPGNPKLTIDAAPKLLESAPTAAQPDEQPSAKLRQRSYEHFGIAPPAWERGPEPMPAGKTDKKYPDKAPEKKAPMGGR